MPMHRPSPVDAPTITTLLGLVSCIPLVLLVTPGDDGRCPAGSRLPYADHENHISVDSCTGGTVRAMFFGLRFDFRNPDLGGVSTADRYAAALEMVEWADELGAA